MRMPMDPETRNFFGVKTLRSFAHPDYILQTLQEKYGLKNAEGCRALKLGGSNDIYSVRFKEGQYIVKIYSQRQCWPYTPEHYLFELNLQLFLKQQDYPVPEPLFNLRGEILDTLILPEGEKYFAVYTHVPGEKWDHKQKGRLRQLGVQIAHLHQLTEHYPIPQLRKLDVNQLLENSWKSIDRYVLLPSETMKNKLYKMYEEIKLLVTSCQLEKDSLRLIHGDVHAGNNLYDARTGQLYILDFELCGFGYLPYEGATLKWDLLNSHTKPFVERSMEDFFSGYSRIASVSQKYLDHLDIFVKLRHFFMLGSSFLFYPDRPHLNSEYMLNYYLKMFHEVF